MAYVEAMKSELDVFADTPIQMSVEQGCWVEYNPISSLENSNCMEFTCPASTEECIDLALTMLQLKVRIVKKDGKAITVEDNVAPVNNFLHSLFGQVEVYMNQKLVTPYANTYAYRSYIYIVKLQPVSEEISFDVIDVVQR